MGIFAQTVQELYVAYFSRPADLGGLQYWEGVVAAQNGSTAAISAAFSHSAEYQAAYAGLSNAQIVDHVYQNLFGRAAEAGGRDYWAHLLDHGAISIDNVVTQVAHGAQGTDAVAYALKVIAANVFTSDLNSSALVTAYDGLAANLQGKIYINLVTDAQTYAKAISPAWLDATMRSVSAAHDGGTASGGNSSQGGVVVTAGNAGGGVVATNVDLGGAGTVIGSGTGLELPHAIGGGALDTVTVGTGNNTIALNNNAVDIIFSSSHSGLNSLTTLSGAPHGLKISLVDAGTETFHAAPVVLDTDGSAPGSLQGFANAAIHHGGDASVNGALSWFQFENNTFLVESRHDGSAPGSGFINGTDFIVKLSGSLDLSHAAMQGSATIILA